jgi:dipeptidyl aminopeptidase/acylaminoacyl peptidase
VKIRRAVALAAVTDLIRAYELHCGNGAVADFIGGSPREFENRYRTSSPLEMLPTGVEQLLIHGTHDDVVPIELSRRYAVAARAAGDAVELIELEEAGHMDFVDPSTAAYRALRRWLTR